MIPGCCAAFRSTLRALEDVIKLAAFLQNDSWGLGRFGPSSTADQVLLLSHCACSWQPRQISGVPVPLRLSTGPLAGAMQQGRRGTNIEPVVRCPSGAAAVLLISRETLVLRCDRA